MKEAAQPTHLIRFETFEVNLWSGELCKNGERIKVQGQSFQILAMLLERPGEVVMRHEIQKRLWPNDTVVEFENSINAAVKRLRLALGDSADQPRYVETLARRGYRWMAPVERVETRPGGAALAAAVLSRQAESTASNLIGKRVSHYRVLEILGGGGMGVVYKGEDIKLGRRVALKFLPEELASDSGALERFEREARAASALNHANICTIYEVEEHDGRPFIVMELLEGRTLREYIGQGGGAPLPTDEVLDLAAQIASGLDAAHQKGIIHRDIKPANVFITARGEAKILDFGLAKLTQREAAQEATFGEQIAGSTPGVVLGTVGYMSPEQVRGCVADHRSDLFSLGAVLYEMASGKRAFQRDSSVETMNAILKSDPPEMSSTDNIVPSALDRLVRRLLEKSPEGRFQSARDLAFALEALSGPSTPSRAPTVPQVPAMSQSRSLQISLAAVAIIALAFLGYWAGVKEKGTPVGSKSYRSVTFRRQVIFNAAFAPDGKTIIYSGALEGNVPEIYVLRPEYPLPQPLGVRDAHLLSVSSKNEIALLTGAKYQHHIFFVGTLATLPLGGGAARELLENVRQADWSPDGSSLAIIHDVGGKDRLEFPVGTVLDETAGWLSEIRFSPKGDRIAFFEHPIRFDDRGTLAAITLTTRNKTVLSPEYWSTEGIAWSPDGREVYYSAGNGRTDAGVVYAATLAGETRIAYAGVGDLMIDDISRDGRVLVRRDEERKELIARSPGAAAERNLSFLNLSSQPRLSSDGRLLAFTEESGSFGSNYSVCVQRSDGSPPVRLGDGNTYDISADGKWVLAIVYSSPPRLTMYPTGPGQAKSMERGAIEAYDSAQWFPDQKRLLVCGNEAGKASRCYTQGLSGTALRPVTPEGTIEGLVSPDGKFVLSQDTEGKSFLFPVEGGTPQPVAGIRPDERAIRWSHDGRSLFVYSPRVIPSKIERLEIQTGRRTRFADLAPMDRTGVLSFQAVSIADDEKSYAYNLRRHLSQLYVIEGRK